MWEFVSFSYLETYIEVDDDGSSSNRSSEPEGSAISLNSMYSIVNWQSPGADDEYESDDGARFRPILASPVDEAHGQMTLTSRA